ncbi:hypothetical protein SLE2022_387350 [Rubroshorea leprosula]
MGLWVQKLLNGFPSIASTFVTVASFLTAPILVTFFPRFLTSFSAVLQPPPPHQNQGRTKNHTLSSNKIRLKSVNLSGSNPLFTTHYHIPNPKLHRLPLRIRPLSPRHRRSCPDVTGTFPPRQRHPLPHPSISPLSGTPLPKAVSNGTRISAA